MEVGGGGTFRLFFIFRACRLSLEHLSCHKILSGTEGLLIVMVASRGHVRVAHRTMKKGPPNAGEPSHF